VEGSSVLCNLQHTTQIICWHIDSMNIVFTFLYAVFYNFHHRLGFLKARNFLTIGAAIVV
jgi:hypothetical protein